MDELKTYNFNFDIVDKNKSLNSYTLLSTINRVKNSLVILLPNVLSNSNQELSVSWDNNRFKTLTNSSKVSFSYSFSDT